jgi:acyl-coenzyme A synthetase/AMP-(fatty) acid ligase
VANKGYNPMVTIPMVDEAVVFGVSDTKKCETIVMAVLPKKKKILMRKN